MRVQSFFKVTEKEKKEYLDKIGNDKLKNELSELKNSLKDKEVLINKYVAENKKLTAESTEMQKSLKSLKNENKKLIDENRTNSSKVNDIMSEKDKSELMYYSLVKENDELIKENDKISDINKGLSQKVDDLISDNKELSQKLGVQSDEKNLLFNRVDDLITENKGLSKKSDGLLVENKILSKKVSDLEEKIKLLVIEKERLKVEKQDSQTAQIKENTKMFDEVFRLKVRVAEEKNKAEKFSKKLEESEKKTKTFKVLSAVALSFAAFLSFSLLKNDKQDPASNNTKVITDPQKTVTEEVSKSNSAGNNEIKPMVSYIGIDHFSTKLHDKSLVTFGKHEMNGNTEDGAEDIVWQFLAWYIIDGEESAYFISRDCIDVKPFDENQGNRWEDCSLRRWLAEDFYNNSFSDDEKEMMIYAYSTDKVSLLKRDEAESRFKSDMERMASSTGYAIQNDINIDSSSKSWWWLRSSKDSDEFVSVVKSDGTISDEGNISNDIHGGVRPVIRVSLK